MGQHGRRTGRTGLRRLAQYNEKDMESFAPGTGLKWTVQTESAAMRDLVEQREIILFQQRELDKAELQAKSEELAEAHLSQLSADNPVPSGNLNTYKRFCHALDIPIYPITSPLLSLAIFARCSTKDGYYSTLKADVQQVMLATAEVWKDEPGFEVLKSMDPEERALEEFMQERRKEKDQPNVAADSFPSTSKSTKRSARSLGERPNYNEHSSAEEAEEEEAEDDDEAVATDGGKGKGKARETEIVQTPTPGLPQHGDTFELRKTAHVQVIKALVPVYGVTARLRRLAEDIVDIRCKRNHRTWETRRSGRCDFHICLLLNDELKRWVVDGTQSNYAHNHNRHSRIVSNPHWRPKVNMQAARKALGMEEPAGKESKEDKGQESMDESVSETSATADSDDEERPPKKKVKASAPSPTPQDVKPEPADVKLPMQEAGPSMLLDQKPCATLAFPHLATPDPTPSQSSANSSQHPYTPPAPPPPFDKTSPASFYHASPALVINAVPIANVLPPIDLAASLLAATHPSRVHLAPALVEAGFRTVEALAFLGYSLSEQSQKVVLDELEQRGRLGLQL
ncbi:hypothetical protein NBRC10512_005658 [Rhodotorula toruloides]|uniref:RHTO0S15e00430g2_1 n=2 Tax=Rhodotorula toruloides TaxID=5286 RepID=A0A061BKV2_RHOTO|nr:uncharacterized protein RHTO_03286 [Rhodotorula toruloides NP11]EMS25557.1 hypothetical protein RHTO_03286 [Rhodotorula toruloides NP11]CDR47672.1 RHTO0S15e00430g2_1 [Rhodotorula toruloides]